MMYEYGETVDIRGILLIVTKSTFEFLIAVLTEPQLIKRYLERQTDLFSVIEQLFSFDLLSFGLCFLSLLTHNLRCRPPVGIHYIDSLMGSGR